MSAQIIRFPTMNVADARQIIANPDLHDDASVLDACELLLADGDWIDHERAKLLHAAIIRVAVAGINRDGRIRHHWRFAGDVIGVASLFAILYLFLLFTPN